MKRQVVAFNRGIVSQLALARAADINRVALSAETMTNWTPRVLGSMMLRPGFGYVGATAGNNAARYLPFVFSTDDTALVELTGSTMRVWVDDTLVTRSAVTASVTNGTFDSDLTGWTDSDDSGATSAWQTGGYLGLTGDGTNFAKRDQEVSVFEVGTDHALSIVVTRGPVGLRIGYTMGGDELFAETQLGTGYHSIAFTPQANFWIRLQSSLERIVLVDSCTVSGSGAMSVTAPWAEADLGKVRSDQSGDVLFVACEGYQQRRIERRDNNSWSVVEYLADRGPFMDPNTTNQTITASGTSGNVTLTASSPLFKSTNVGGLYQITSNGQNVSASISAQNTFTDSIKVTGVSGQRVFGITITGTWSATVTLQASTDDATWTDISNYTANTSTSRDDELDNQVVYYRIGVKTGNYTSGTAVVQLTYSLGGIVGVVRVTAYTSVTSAEGEVLVTLGGTDATDNWAEGRWSDRRGWPSAVAFAEGRLWWSGKNGVFGSVSDAFDNFDPDFEGDAGPIDRTIGSGPVDTINWILALQRLILGAEGAEFTAKSTSLDEPLTPTNFNIKPTSTQGSANVSAVKVDSRGIFVQRGGTRVFELSVDGSTYDYNSSHLSALAPEIGQPGIVRIGVQRQPDTRVHFVRSDGSAAMLVYDRVEEVTCWIEIETAGDIEDVVILPAQNGQADDQVYYVAKDFINGSTVRYLLKWAQEADCQGGTLNKQADYFVTFENDPASLVVSGLSHLEGESVVVWADGQCLRAFDGSIAEFEVDSGSIALSDLSVSFAATTGVVGLPYTAQWKSGKFIELYEQGSSAIGTKKLIETIALILYSTHNEGVEYGRDFDNLDSLPQVRDGAAVTAGTVASWEQDAVGFPGTWGADARLCLKASAPRPATVLALVAEYEA